MRFYGRSLLFLLLLLPFFLILSTTAQLTAQDAAHPTTTDISKLIKQAKSGDAQAEYDLGEAYLDGRGVPKDEAEAVRWFRKAAEQGNAAAQTYVAVGYVETKNYVEAVRWYRKAAEQGDLVAGGQLCAFEYESGAGLISRTNYDPEPEDARLCRKVAEQGYADAQLNLGQLYANGFGVPKDEAEAVRWYLKAAEHGLAIAQHDLAWMYRNGQGAAKDEAEAARWFRKAAEQGYARAQLMLGMSYELGEGVPKDETEAYFWLNLSGSILPEAGAERDRMGASFTSAKRMEIQERCTRWTETHPASYSKETEAE